MTVAVLFARRDSVYKTIPGLDVYDIDRDALSWPGGCPVVAHPPCRGWGRLRAFAKPRPGEKELALFAVDAIRRYGGVLEHPSSSSLWPAAGLPRPGAGCDRWGGWTLEAPQFWWGHRAMKNTWFYIMGVSPRCIPVLPISLGDATHVVTETKAARRRPALGKAEREHTPAALASWLVELASRCSVEVMEAAS